MPVVLPALSEDGWVSDAQKVADYLFSHFILSDYSQSYLYSGKISSLPYLLQQYGANPTDFNRQLKTTLEQYFSRYFSDVLVDAQVQDDPSNPNIQNIYLYVSFTDAAGTTYSLGRMIASENTLIKKVVTLSNYGVDTSTLTAL